MSCPSCGASVRETATACPLCGTALDAPAEESAVGPLGRLGSDDAGTSPEEAVSAGVEPARSRPAAATGTDVACPACGHHNRPAARFCDACGTPLADPAVESGPPARRPAPPPVAEAAVRRPDAPAGRRALGIVGAGVLAVAALYAINAISGGAPTDPTPATPSAADPAGSAAVVPDGPTPPLADSLQAAADALEAQDSASGWYEAGRYYLTAGFEAQQRGEAEGVLWIRRAVADFERSLALEDDPDVRFALAEAAQFDPADPMRPVLELQTLLSETPDHVGGNFLMGERRMVIGRLDSARVSFERVVALAPAGDPLRERAAEMIATLAQAGAATRGVPDGTGAAPPAGAPGALPAP